LEGFGEDVFPVGVVEALEELGVCQLVDGFRERLLADSGLWLGAEVELVGLANGGVVGED
jgi:hypothetical protein